VSDFVEISLLNKNILLWIFWQVISAGVIVQVTKFNKALFTASNLLKGLTT